MLPNTLESPLMVSLCGRLILGKGSCTSRMEDLTQLYYSNCWSNRSNFLSYLKDKSPQQIWSLLNFLGPLWCFVCWHVLRCCREFNLKAARSATCLCNPESDLNDPFLPQMKFWLFFFNLKKSNLGPTPQTGFGGILYGFLGCTPLIMRAVCRFCRLWERRFWRVLWGFIFLGFGKTFYTL